MTSELGKAMLIEHGFRPDEEMRVGDYDLLLICHVPTTTYHLAVQRVGMDFTDIQQQKSRKPNHLSGSLSDFHKAISYWLDRHGKLYMASHDPRKNTSYPRILRKMGFKVGKADFYGHMVFEVTQ